MLMQSRRTAVPRVKRGVFASFPILAEGELVTVA